MKCREVLSIVILLLLVTLLPLCIFYSATVLHARLKFQCKAQNHMFCYQDQNQDNRYISSR